LIATVIFTTLLSAAVGRAQPTSPLPEGHPPINGSMAGAPTAAGPDDAQPLPPDHPPLGPADLIRRSQPTPSVASTPRDRIHQLLEGGPPIASERPSVATAAGSITVRVVDPGGAPLSSVPVRLGILERSGGRREERGSTGGDGTLAFTGLPTGEAQAYRVHVDHEGARYGSNPFRLPADHGYEVQITRLPTTRDDRSLLQILGQTFVELRDERLHVIQQAQLMNHSDATYVFPNDGLRVVLPEGAKAFDTQETMTDQQLVGGDGEFWIRGSIPPGPVSLVWAYDVPVTGSDQSFAFTLPWPTFIYRVTVQAPVGIEMSVPGFPPPQQFDEGGERQLMTQLRRSPDEPRLERVRVELSGIPGPGPGRWVAVAIALSLLAMGTFFGISGRGSLAASVVKARTRKKQRLLSEAVELDRLLRAEDIGPKYHARERQRIVDELAALLAQEASGGRPARPRRATVAGRDGAGQ
jgi:hypothetical protein